MHKLIVITFTIIISFSILSAVTAQAAEKKMIPFFQMPSMPKQQEIPRSGSGKFIINLLSEKCVDVVGAPGTNNGARLQLWDCEYSGYGPNNSISDQKWEMTNEGFIRNMLSGKCIDVKGTPGTNNGAQLQLWDCEYSGYGPNNTITDQRWEMTKEGFIRNVLSGKCMDVQGTPGTNNGAPINLWDCEYPGYGSSITDQRWTWEK